MKKSSRDYRRNNRKKWLIIRKRNFDLSMSAMLGAHAISIIQSTPGLTKEEKALKVIQQVIHTANMVTKSLSQ